MYLSVIPTSYEENVPQIKGTLKSTNFLGDSTRLFNL